MRFDRNYIRQVLAPTIKQRWPSVNKTLSRVIDHCVAAQSLLENLADQDLLMIRGSKPFSLSISELLKLGLERSFNALRRWFHLLNFPLPSQAQLNHIFNDVIDTGPDRHAKVQWDKYEIRRYRDDLYVLPQQQAALPKSIVWNLNKTLQLPQCQLIAQKKLGPGIRLNAFPTSSAIVKFREFGERCHPTGRQGSHPLKKLFQEWGVPPWERERIPLLYNDSQLVSVIGHCICEPFTSQNVEESWQIEIMKYPCHYEEHAFRDE